MNKMRMPAKYVPVSEDDQRNIQGGGPVWDAIYEFVDNLSFTDFVLGSSIIFIGFTFMPGLLFNAARAVYGLGKEIFNGVQDLFGQIAMPFSRPRTYDQDNQQQV